MAQQQTLLPNQDPASPFYLHPTDNTASQLVSAKFKEEGYGDWKSSMMISMSSKNKLGFVNGTIVQPDITRVIYDACARCNDMMISWLLFNLDTTIAKSVLYFNTAREIWVDLEERFGFVSGPQLYSLEQQAVAITQGGQNIAEFFTEIKSIWDKMSAANPLPSCTCNLCTCNLTQKIFKMQQDQRLMQFLMKLGEHLSTARGNLLMMQPLPTISHAYRMLAQEERQREISALVPQMESHAFGADRRRYNDFPNRNNNYTPYKGQQGQSYGRSGYSYNNQSGGNKSIGYKKPFTYFCDQCKVNGHSTKRCFKLHGFPPGFTGFKNDKRAAAATYIDETYFDDMADYQHQFYSGDKEQNQPGFLTAEQCTQLLSLLNKQQTEKSSNADAQVEEGETSGHAFMADSGASVHMCVSLSMFDSYEPIKNSNEYITIPDGRRGHLMKRPLVLGSVRSGLYSVESGQKQHITEESTTCLSASNASRNNAEVWHLRLGHMPFNKMKLIVSDLIEPSNNDSICQVCPAAKQSRVSIPISSIKTTERFQMIHLDTWGLTRFNTKVLCVRSDNALELCEGDMK
ncbi:uncharacterized protein [Spinacia oleracea]|uniref:Retrotransposon Copia-like N-terminal domain-containing protein n=1 Tax=Spinacia oleracea TaxID=3562 RepID=A0A9R0I7F5_SPIOL|nr:uncharacterized protein LOC110783549 [Spinacia oleracea]